jgi:HIV Tat-specific factor 1
MERPFPVEVQEFDSDDRISFSRLDQKFIAVHDDGSEFEFEFETKKWIPIEDDHPAEDGHPAENGHQENAAGQSPMKRKVDDTDGSEVCFFKYNCTELAP